MLASVAVLVLYVNHAGRALTVAGLIDLVGDDLREQLDRVYPRHLVLDGARRDGDPGVVLSPEPG